eukprot:CAMPEP_0115677248 /NCGR_PEP_ID=MMETSP0272-20121206/55120_1 /TAXON_ID=71861 /ORGANISM="Scrippsiella trochoidea, Strain CCMP3099" /LENGTH=134 /DNA_ID=CAMNT_0003116345 /DNA_START=72 /DNA_END=477 /DNA_ORIENTATION=+
MAPTVTGDEKADNLLPAAGIGAAACWVLGIASLSTLGIVGIGAGVGYGVGTWAVDKVRDLRCKNAMDKLPEPVKVALELFAEFAQQQPSNAQLVHSFVTSHGGRIGGAGPAAAPRQPGAPGTGPTIVPCVAANV